MKNVQQILKALAKNQFRLVYANGNSTVKIYPPNPAQPFYSFHVGERGLHPLRRFARANWGVDINAI